MYSRELYNAIRQTMVDGTSGTAPAYTMVSKEDYGAVKQVLGRIQLFFPFHRSAGCGCSR